MIAVYYILKAIGLSEGAMIRIALIIVYSAGTGVGFYVAKGFFDTIPKALDEAEQKVKILQKGDDGTVTETDFAGNTEG